MNSYQLFFFLSLHYLAFVRLGCQSFSEIIKWKKWNAEKHRVRPIFWHSVADLSVRLIGLFLGSFIFILCFIFIFQIGLFLGGSVLSIIEFIYFFTFRLFLNIRNSKSHNIVTPIEPKNENSNSTENSDSIPINKMDGKL